MTGRYGFGREARLRKRREYRETYDRGRRVRGRFFLCFFLKRPSDSSAGDESPRLGVTVVRRVGRATKRNRLKRITREFFRLRRPEMKPGWDVVVNVHPSAVGQPTRMLWDELETIFRKAGALTRRRDERPGA